MNSLTVRSKNFSANKIFVSWIAEDFKQKNMTKEKILDSVNLILKCDNMYKAIKEPFFNLLLKCLDEMSSDIIYRKDDM